MRTLIAALLLALASAPALAGTEELTLTTKRGAKVPVVVHVPKPSKGKLPAVLIAPGQGYHMGLPLITGLAKESAAAGLIAFRFDWAYTATKSRPSPDLSSELEDMETVLAALLADERVDPDRVFVAGKSMGTYVSYRLFAAHPKLKALFLLTPVMRGGVEQGYPKLAATTRPILMTLGNRDPLCPLPKLYAALATTTGNVATVVVAGDHGMNVGDYRDPAFTKRNAANVGAAVAATVHWMRLVLEG
jgi:dienelactone hydrolase